MEIKKETLELERKTILKKYYNLISSCKNILNHSDLKLIRKAFERTLTEHKNDRRSNGEPFIYEVLDIAQIVVSELGLGRTSIISSMLYDIVKNTHIEIEEIEKIFDKKVSGIIEGVVKIRELYDKHDTLRTSSFRKLLYSFAKDIRVILIMLADRLYQIRNMDNLSKKDQLEICSEISYLYVPIAHRLGLYNIKAELEDSILKYTNPDIYNHINQELKASEKERKRFIKDFIEPIKQKLDTEGFKYKIKSRTKAISSIWTKMQKQQVEFKEVYDVFAIRIIINSKELNKEKSDCWLTYSFVSDIYQPNPKRLRDWVTVPKTTGYESLHTTVLTKEGKWVEVQIRTKRMDEIAELGFAAHWKYKGGKSSNLDALLTDIRQVLESTESSPSEIFDDLKFNAYTDEIFVFTPNGDLVQLPKGSTALDFAFSIHTQVGYNCTGATVNQRNVPLKTKLKSGDYVSVITSKNQKPKADWLNFVVTSKAISKIKQSIKEEKYKEVESGRELLQRRLKNWKLEFSDDNIKILMDHFKIKLAMDLYCSIANESIDISDIKEVLTEKDKEEKITHIPLKKIEEKSSTPKDILVIDKNVKNIDYQLSKCCNPIFGDDIFGFISIGKGIKVHRKSCSNAKMLKERYPYRIIEAEWTNKAIGSYQAEINITGDDDFGFVNRISEIITKEFKINIRSFTYNSNAGLFNGNATLMVSDINHLEALIKKLRTIKGVNKVVRYDALG